MKPYIVIFLAPTTHKNSHLPFKTLPSGKKQASMYFENLTSAIESIQAQSIRDKKLSYELVRATPRNVEKYL